MSQTLTTRRTGNVTKPRTGILAKPSKATNVDSLASDLAGLRIADKKGMKQRENPASELSSEENRVLAMKTINSTSQTLSKFVQAGLKYSRQPRSTSTSEVKTCAETITRALKVLRGLDALNLDIEKAALSVVGKLVSMEFYELSLTLLSDIHRRLLSLLHPQIPLPQLSLTHLHLLSVSLPTTVPDSAFLVVLSTFFVHTLTAIIHLSPSTPDFIHAITSSSLLHWAPIFSGKVDTKHMDTIMTRAYSTLAKSPIPSLPPPATFTLRCYGLACLTYTTPETISPDTFWDQAIKYTGSLLKSAGTKDDVLSLVLVSFEDLVARVEATSPDRSFTGCQQFIAFCECWTGIAKRASRLDVMQRIGQLMSQASSGCSPSSTPSSKTPTDPLTNARRPTSFRAAAAALCTSFSQAQVAWDPQTLNIDTGLKLIDQVVYELAKSSYIWQSMTGANEGGSKDVEAAGKAQRALERLRRQSVKLFDDESLDHRLRVSLRKLHESIIDTIEPNLSENGTPDTYTQILDSLFALSRTTLDVRNAHSHGASYDYLERAAKILQVDTERSAGSQPCATLDKPNYLRCVSGAFHNLAGTLYNADRHGSAVRFLRRACELGALALDMKQESATKAPGVEEAEKDAQAWRQLQEQLHRRWELLGVCHCKIGDHKAGYEAFTEAIKAYPFPVNGVVANNDGDIPVVDFNSSAGLKQLGTIIDRVTYMGTCELFLPPLQVSLLSVLGGDKSPSGKLLGALIERQMESLTGSQWKEGVPAVTRQLLRDLLTLYDPTQSPLRRARIYVRCLEVAYYDTCLLGECGFNGYAAVVQDLQGLLSQQDYSQAKSAGHCKGPLLALAHAWAALHAHRAAAEGQIVDITHHANEACILLASTITAVSRKSMNNVRQSKSSPVVAARRVSSPKVFRKLPSPKAPRKAPPKRTITRRPPILKPKGKTSRVAPPEQAATEPTTPKPRASQVLRSPNVPSSRITNGSADGSVSPSEDLVKLLDVLHALTNMLGLVGLTLTKIRILIAIRKVTEGQLYEVLNDSYVSASVDLALEYISLGKVKKAASIHKQILGAIQTGGVTTVSRIKFLLQYAQALALGDNSSLSTDAYNQAAELSEQLPKEQKGLPTAQRIQRRVDQLEAAALAARTYATIQYLQSDIPSTIDSLLQSLRLYNRALDTMARLSSTTPSELVETNPFQASHSETASSHEDALAAVVKPSLPKTAPQRKAALNGCEWSVADGLFNTFFSIVGVYSARGSPREAQYFAQQAYELAESLNAPMVMSRALARLGELQIYQGQLSNGQDSLIKAAELLVQTQCTDVVDIDRLRAECNLRGSQLEDARQLYERARSALGELDQSYGAYESGPRRSSLSTTSGKELLAPQLLAKVLSQYIWLLRDGDCDERSELLDAFLALPPSWPTRAEQASLVAKLTMHNIFGRFGMDMFLSSLTESTIAIPIGMTCQDSQTLSVPPQDVLALLEKASLSYWQELALIATQGEVPKFRSATVSLALVHALQTSLGKGGEGTSTLLINLLDASIAITLHREMLEVAQHKFLQFRPVNDLQWPSMNASQIPALSPPRFNLEGTLDDSDEEDGTMGDQITKDYWEYVRTQHKATTLDQESLSTSRLLELPSNWTVVHICVTDDRKSLFITRQYCGHDQPEPLIFCVPLTGRREGDGEENEEHLSFDDASNELAEIIRLSDEGTRSAVHVNQDDMSAREQWWKERRELDTRLRELLENIEFCWLGAFKSILSRRSKMEQDMLNDLRLHFDRVFQNGLHLQDKGKPRSKGKKSKATAKSPNHFQLNDALLECFSTLSPKCRDEELEDLVYFILDLYQFHGIPVATAEVDVTQVTVDLRGVLEEHSQRLARRMRAAQSQNSPPADDEHIFLVLDKNVQGLPWESMPILRGRSVSRIPNTRFLLDRIQYANMLQPDAVKAGNGCSRGFVDPRRTYYMLNPSGDLKKSEARFKGWLEEMKQSVGWDGVVGHAPSEQQFLDALERNDLFIYFGHGGGEQYARSHKIRNLKRCSAVMLWGCSSGALKDMGDYDRIGTPYNYMLAGSPCLVANLWDVTDRDIDKFSQEVFDKLRLDPKHVKAWNVDRSAEGTSLVRAVAEAREVCKLKYLTGAAAVVYGVPYYL